MNYQESELGQGITIDEFATRAKKLMALPYDKPVELKITPDKYGSKLITSTKKLCADYHELQTVESYSHARDCPHMVQQTEVFEDNLQSDQPLIVGDDMSFVFLIKGNLRVNQLNTEQKIVGPSFIGPVGRETTITSFDGDATVLRIGVSDAIPIENPNVKEMFDDNLLSGLNLHSKSFVPNVFDLRNYLNSLEGQGSGVSSTGDPRKTWLTGPGGEFQEGKPGYCPSVAIGIWNDNKVLLDDSALVHGFNSQLVFALPTNYSNFETLPLGVEEGFGDEFIGGVKFYSKAAPCIFYDGGSLRMRRQLWVPPRSLLILMNFYRNPDEYLKTPVAKDVHMGWRSNRYVDSMKLEKLLKTE